MYKKRFKEGVSLKGVQNSNPKRFMFSGRAGIFYLVVQGTYNDESFWITGGVLQGSPRAFTSEMKSRGIKVVKVKGSSDYNVILPSYERANVEDFLNKLQVEEMK